ncbi:hypothetical protein TIFTF001_001601 [Ficus carica]|uniref:Uncharacterized protein n=1 Tax=Ficus carica TaxID=3494 RepID=A0AA87Z0V0_FICCA|nr:hypothetical protein TIFTF001_001601 [Ficus carica]
MGRPSCKGLSCGRGSVARAGTSEPDGDLLEVFKGEIRLLWYDRVTLLVGSSLLDGQKSLLVLAHLVPWWISGLQCRNDYVINNY